MMTERTLNDLYLSELRQWMKRHIERRKVSLNAVARGTDTGIATISRLVSEDNATLPSLPTVFALERYFGEKAPSFGGEVEYFDKDEAIPIPEEHAPHFSLKPKLSLWKIQSEALESLGVEAGDYMVVDMDAVPQDNDLVLAEIKDWDRPEPYTIFRRYTATPVAMLVALSLKKAFPSQMIIDNRSTSISGVVVGSYKAFKHHTLD